MTSALVGKLTISQIAALWSEVERDIRQAYALIDGASSRLDAALGSAGHYVNLDLRHRSFRGYGKPDTTIDYLRNFAWAGIVQRLGLREMMSLEDLQKLDEALSDGKGDLGPIDEPTLNATLRRWLQQIPDMARASVCEVYEMLRPRSKLKTNSPFQVGDRVILHYAVDAADKRWTWRPRVNYHAVDKLRALDRVFRLLDGRGAVTPTHYGELYEAIHALAPEETEGSTEYFAFRCCRNGNLHLRFLRKDLVLELNRIAGSDRLAA